MPHLTSMVWDYLDQLHSASNGTFTSYYNYDSEGNRTRKVVVKNNIIETRYYINGYELYRKEINGVVDFERKTINISDDEKVFVRVEQKTGENPIVRYQYDNHLGSTCLELDNTGQIISYEEYHPFGTTSYRSGRSQTEVSLKRYKYCGKERDEETGLYYYGMRYYATWICRFVSVDPLAREFPWQSPYSAFNNNPILYIDPDGRAAIMSLGGGDPISDLFKRAVNYVVNRAKQAAYDATISLTKSAIDYADRNYNPVTIYDNITNPHSDLPKWQAESLAKYSDVAVSSDDFITSIRGLSKNEAKRQESGRGAFGSQSGGPTSRYVVDPANSDRVIDMRHFLSIGDMGEAIGLGVEVMQSTRDRWRPSAFDLQDFYSNNLGQQFYDSNFYQEYKSGDVDFSQALDNFFKNRSEQ